MSGTSSFFLLDDMTSIQKKRTLRQYTIRKILHMVSQVSPPNSRFYYIVRRFQLAKKSAAVSSQSLSLRKSKSAGNVRQLASPASVDDRNQETQNEERYKNIL